MTTGNTTNKQAIFNSRLSFRPLVTALRTMITDGKPGSKKLYGDLIDRFESLPELLQPVDDFGKLKDHAELVEMLLATIFPPTTTEAENLYAIAFPFQFKTIYSSRLFQKLFVKPGTEEINVPNDQIGEQLYASKLLFAYYLILRKFANYNAPQASRAVYPYFDPSTGITRYLELNIDARFVEVRTVDGSEPVLPENAICRRTNRVMDLERLQKEMPLSGFIFEGLVIVRMNDVTHQEVISEIKNSLLDINAFSSETVYEKLQGHIQSLVGLKGVKIGVTPFFKVNGHYVYSQLHNSNSLLFKHFTALAERDDVSDCCQQLFYDSDTPIVFETLNREVLTEIEYLKYYYDSGIRSLIACPLKHNNELIGLLEIVSENPGELNNTHISKIEAAIPLFTLALEKSAEALDNQIDKIIKEKFTAVQPAVEWKFTDVALNYLMDKQNSEDVKIGRIAFDEVYPLFGAIDVRNSSVERSHAIQLDLIDQLNSVKTVIKKAQKEMHFPLLQEIEFKIEKYIASASASLLSEEELMIHDFLRGQVVSILNHLSSTLPSIKKDVDNYLASLDPQVGMVYHHRKEFEQSITRINDAVAKFVDREQGSAQQVYPHYFERYVTDGVEFNIYIGQSIAPRRKFDELYLRNMKMWQLSVLAKAAQLTYKLQRELPYPLQTTQLILAHSIPISISFRTAERKFDVEGAYNIRYEIIKKRIDKVRIKETNERLTQPGKIAVVYSQPKEATEYIEYIEFLQNQNLLKKGIEHLELEELQGVVGLKALRVDVETPETEKVKIKPELSSTTTELLIGK